MKNQAVLRTFGRAPEAHSPAATCRVHRADLAAVSWSER